jgi:N-acetylglucosaminylphosphatidylinositol deacetylase
MWFTILALVFVLAIISWCRQRLRATELLKVKEHFDEGNDLVIFVIAHPDDESMFFSPAIRALLQCRIRVQVLCLSKGNFEGLGNIRVIELRESCQTLGLTDKPTVRDVLEDGPFPWDPMIVANEIKLYIEQLNPHSPQKQTHICTFDRHGVSGHPNHISIAKGVQLLLNPTKGHSELLKSDYDTDKVSGKPCNHKNLKIKLIELESSPYKWTGFIAPLLETIRSSIRTRSNLPANSIEIVPTLSFAEYLEFGVGAMIKHQTQMVWFRYLYLAFSSHMHVNRLKIISK